VRREKRVWALHLLPMLAILGTILGGCGLPSNGYYGGGSNYYGSSSYYRSPSYYRSHRHDKHRTEKWSQQRLQQHWLEQAQRPR
jgi:hypothetical protein